jgi:hypothetical protein
MLHLFNEVPVFVIVILMVGAVAGIIGAVRHFTSRDLPCKVCGTFKRDVFGLFAVSEGCPTCNNAETAALYEAFVTARDRVEDERKARDNRSREAKLAMQLDRIDALASANEYADEFAGKWGMSPKMALKRHNSSKVVKMPKSYA